MEGVPCLGVEVGISVLVDLGPVCPLFPGLEMRDSETFRMLK